MGANEELQQDLAVVLRERGDAAAPRTHPLRVLLAEDNAINRMVAIKILAKDGHVCEVVVDGRAAVEAVQREPFDVVLMDCQMPELDGFDLAALIREHPRFVNTAIMFVSGVHLTDLDRLRGYSAGAVDYIPVPVVPELLRARVRVFVDLYRKSRQLERLNRELEERVALRTSDLEASNARLHQSEERLELALAAARAGIDMPELCEMLVRRCLAAAGVA